MLYTITEMGTSVVVGIDWIHLTGTAKEKAQQKRAHLDALNSVYYVTLQRNQHVAFGAADAERGKLSAKAVSGAAWIAKTLGPSNRLVFIKELGNDLVWLLVFDRGLPMARGDRIVEKKSLNNALDDLMINNERKDFKFIFDELSPGSLQEILNVDGDVKQVHLRDLLKGTMPRGCFFTLRRSMHGVFAIAGALLCLAVIGIWQYQSYTAKQVSEAKMPAPPPPKPEAVYLNNFTTYFASVPRFRAAQLLGYLYQQVRKQDVLQNGWTFVRANCQSTQKSCTVEFKRNPFATELQWNSSKPFRIDQGMDLVRVQFSIDLAVDSLPRLQNPMELQAVFPVDTIITSILPMLQSWRDLGMQARLESPNAIPAVPTNNSIIQVHEGKWQVSGPMTLFELLERLPLSLYADVVEISVTDSAAQFTIGGVYWSTLNRAGAT